MRSFAHCSSSASTLPSSVEAKPHCGDRQSCSSATYLVASSMRRLMSSLRSSRPRLGRDQAEHELLVALGEIAQRLEAAGAVAVVFQEIAVEIGVREQMLGDVVVAARGDEGGAEIAAAGMHGDRHVGRLAFERRVGHARIDRRQAVGIVAAAFRALALLGIADHRPGGVVELQIAAAGVVEGADRLAPGGGDVGEEFVIAGIGLLAHHRAALPEVKRARRRNAHFRRDVAMAFKEFEMLDHAGGRRNRPCR